MCVLYGSLVVLHVRASEQEKYYFVTVAEHRGEPEKEKEKETSKANRIVSAEEQ